MIQNINLTDMIQWYLQLNLLIQIILAFMVLVFIGFLASIRESINRRREERQALNRKREKQQQEKENLREQREREQQALVEKLFELRESSLEIPSEIERGIENASGWLRQSEDEYRANAFAPYWDAVENAALNLGFVHTQTTKLVHGAREYSRLAEGVTHEAGGFPVSVSDVPNPARVSRELNRIVRLGQTNFEFANIWEHRKSRKVMIAGFDRLDLAIGGLEYELGKSMGDFQAAISGEMSTQTEMLDNIQNRRKPYPY